MASKRIEDKHKSAMEGILSRSGLVCNRSPTVSDQVSDETLTAEDTGYTDFEEEPSLEVRTSEESSKELLEERIEEESAIFPTPSLRRLLPDKIRKIEEHNRIHVLPKEFKTNINPALIPKIVPQVKYIDIIAGLVGCTEYKSSLAEFWFLDTLANLLRRAQEAQLPRTTQAVLMLWFCEWMKEIQNFDAADRQRMLRRFKDNMLSAARYIAEIPQLPTPKEAGVRYRALDEEDQPNSKSSEVEDDMLVNFDECAYECAMRDLVTIMHYIFDLAEKMKAETSGDKSTRVTNFVFARVSFDVFQYRFSTDYQFDLVRSIFTFTPEYHLIDLPHTLMTPKRMFAPFKPKKEKHKKEPGKKEKKKKEPDTEEYLALMELKARDEREFEERELKDAEAWNKRNSILPLTFAGTDELFEKYWPPPEPEPEPEPEPKPEKGRKKKH